MSVQQGVYRIRNRKSGTYFDASVQNKGEIHGWASHPENQNQKWSVEEAGQGYRLKNLEFGEFAGITGYEDGSRVVLTGNPTEWELQDKGNGAHAIVVAGTQQSCDLDMGHKANGTHIAIYGWHGAEQQQWEFESVGDLSGGGGGGGGGYIAQPPQQQQQEYQQQPPVQMYSGAVPAGKYLIENAFSGTAADLAGAGTADGTPITGWECNRGANQTWELIPAQNGYYFKNASSGTYLGFQGAGAEGTMICGSSNPVEWQVNQADQGYSIRLASSPEVVLDLAGGGKDDGVKICLYNNHSGANQQWKFNPPA